MGDLLGQAVTGRLIIIRANAEQDEKALSYGTAHLALNLNGCLLHPCHNCFHFCSSI